MIESYEASTNQQGQNVAAPSSESPKTDVKPPVQSVGGSQANGSGSPASPTAVPQNGGQPGTQAAGNQPAMRPDLGDSVKSFESGNRGVASVSSGVNDPGGVSYGTYQLSSNARTLQGFLNSPEGGKYSAEFAGLKPGSVEFSEKWKALAARDPEGLHQAEKTFIYRTHYQPVISQAAEAGLDMNNPAIQDAVWSGAVQHGPGGVRKVLDAVKQDPDLKSKTVEEQLKSYYWARSGNGSSTSQWNAKGGRYFGRNETDPGEFEAVRARNEAYKQATARH